MKHLQRKENIVPKEGSMLITESVTEKDTAIKAKMHQVEPTLFGKKLINYKCEEIKRVWVPYYFLVYDYHGKAVMWMIQVPERCRTMGPVEFKESLAGSYIIGTADKERKNVKDKRCVRDNGFR